jgi:methylated-DNA-[protein]-cysteine S-methyltransferase
MQQPLYYTYLPSPIGPLLARAEGSLVSGLFMPGHQGQPQPEQAWIESDEPFRELREQMEAYFDGRLHEFELPLRMAGTPFQRRVWQELVKIPFGTTITYAQLAARIGQPSAARAVGHANSRNPISIVVPCHRVIGADGSLTGYAGGLDKKRWLLEFERRGSVAEREPLLWTEDDGWLHRRGSTVRRSPSIAARSGKS